MWTGSVFHAFYRYGSRYLPVCIFPGCVPFRHTQEPLWSVSNTSVQSCWVASADKHFITLKVSECIVDIWFFPFFPGLVWKYDLCGPCHVTVSESHVWGFILLAIAHGVLSGVVYHTTQEQAWASHGVLSGAGEYTRWFPLRSKCDRHVLPGMSIWRRGWAVPSGGFQMCFYQEGCWATFCLRPTRL